METVGQPSPVERFLSTTSVLEGLKRAAAESPHAESFSNAAELYFLDQVYPAAMHPEVVDYFQNLGDMYHTAAERDGRLVASGEISEEEFIKRNAAIATDPRFQRAVFYLMLFAEGQRTPAATDEKPRLETGLEKTTESWPIMELSPDGYLIFGDQQVQLTEHEKQVLTGLCKQPGKFLSRKEIISYGGDLSGHNFTRGRSEYVFRWAFNSLAYKLAGLSTDIALETQNQGLGARKNRLWGARLKTGTEEEATLPFSPEGSQDQQPVEASLLGREVTMSRGAYTILDILEEAGGPVFIGALREKMFGSRTSSDELEERLVNHIMEAQAKSLDGEGEEVLEIKAPSYWPELRANMLVRVRFRLLKKLGLQPLIENDTR